MRKLRLREAKSFSQGYTAGEQWVRNSRFSSLMRVALPALPQTTSILPRCCHQFRDSLACEECTGEGRRPERWGRVGGHTAGDARVQPGAPICTPLCPAAPQACSAQGSPATCAASVPRPVVPSPPHTLPARERPPNSPWQQSPHFLSTCWGLQLSRQVLLTSSQEFT